MSKLTLKTKTGHRRILSNELIKDLKINKSLYLMFIPVLIYYIIFHYVPMYGALIAFQDFRPSIGFLNSEWVGLKHFTNFLTSASFVTVLKNTLRISLCSLIFEFPAPIIFAILLNSIKNVRYSKVVQNITYLPHFVSLVVICGMIKEFTRDTGIVTQFLTLFGFEAKSLLNHPQYFLPVYIISNLWQQIGWSSIIYLAALTAVDPSLIEASIIDGAGKWKQLIHVTLPAIVPTIIVMLILKIGGILNVGYEKIILLYNDLTMEVADVISSFVYRKGLLEQNWSFSTAVNMFNSIINLILLFLANTISRKVGGSSLW